MHTEISTTKPNSEKIVAVDMAAAMANNPFAGMTLNFSGSGNIFAKQNVTTPTMAYTKDIKEKTTATTKQTAEARKLFESELRKATAEAKVKPKTEALRKDRPSVEDLCKVIKEIGPIYSQEHLDFILDTLGDKFNIQEEDLHTLSRAVELEVYRY